MPGCVRGVRPQSLIATPALQDVGGISRQRRCLANRALASAAQGYVGALQCKTLLHTPIVAALTPVLCTF